MVSSNWAALTDGLSPEDQALLEHYRDTVMALDDADSRSAKDDAPHPGRIEERVHATEVAFAVKRVFTSAHIKSHRLQLVIDLLREAEHPLLRATFHTTAKVITHRLDATTAAEIDSLVALLREARDTVGPGTR